jgi:hypothetical protein
VYGLEIVDESWDLRAVFPSCPRDDPLQRLWIERDARGRGGHAEGRAVA